MPTVQQWGRNESHHLAATRLSLHARSVLPLARSDRILCLCPLPIWPFTARTLLPAVLSPQRDAKSRASCQQLSVALCFRRQLAGATRARSRRGVRGRPPQLTGAPLPLALSAQARQQGFRLLFREQPRNYPNQTFHAWLAQWIYDDVPLDRLFNTQLMLGLAAFVLQLPFSIRKDIQRRKQLRYGRRLKGPILVSPRQFTKAVAGNGIGIATNDSKRPLRIPRDAENKHFLIVGDTGSGKSSIIRQMLYQVDARGDSAIVYDPACEFVKQFYDAAPRRHRAQSA